MMLPGVLLNLICLVVVCRHVPLGRAAAWWSLVCATLCPASGHHRSHVISLLNIPILSVEPGAPLFTSSSQALRVVIKYLLITERFSVCKHLPLKITDRYSVCGGVYFLRKPYPFFLFISLFLMSVINLNLFRTSFLDVVLSGINGFVLYIPCLLVPSILHYCFTFCD